MEALGLPGQERKFLIAPGRWKPTVTMGAHQKDWHG